MAYWLLVRVLKGFYDSSFLSKSNKINTQPTPPPVEKALSLSLSPQFLPSSGPHVQLHTGYKKTNLLWNSGRTLTGWRLFCSYMQQSYVCVLEASWVCVKEATVTQKHVHIRKRTQRHPWKKHLHHDCCFWLFKFSRKNKYAVIRCQTKELHILQVSMPTPPRVNGEYLQCQNISHCLLGLQGIEYFCSPSRTF